MSVRNKQTRLESGIESWANILSGFIISYLTWILIVPIFWPEHKSTYSTAFGIVILFTVASFIRSYLWRRFFENDLHKFIHKTLSSWR